MNDHSQAGMIGFITLQQSVPSQMTCHSQTLSSQTHSSSALRGPFGWPWPQKRIYFGACVFQCMHDLIVCTGFIAHTKVFGVLCDSWCVIDPWLQSAIYHPSQPLLFSVCCASACLYLRPLCMHLLRNIFAKHCQQNHKTCAAIQEWMQRKIINMCCEWMLQSTKTKTWTHLLIPQRMVFKDFLGETAVAVLEAAARGGKPYMYMCICICALAYAHMDTCAHTHKHTHICTYIHAHIYIYIHTYTHVYTHTFSNTYNVHAHMIWPRLII